MFKYRVIKKTFLNRVWYEPEKRFLGFLWWYNFMLDLEGYSTGQYDTLKEAINCIERDRSKTKTEIIKEFK